MHALLIGSPKAFSLSYTLLGHTGLMQQPSSQYYHEIYGLTGKLFFEDSGFFTSLTYLERPKFKAYGFADQEQFAHLNFGKILIDEKHYRLDVSVGPGRVWGYVEFDGQIPASLETNSRDFYINGAAYNTSFSVYLSKVALSISHTFFAGYRDKGDFDSYVLWPYLFFSLGIGVGI